MIGRTLSHYRILDELGKGGMGEVYRALDEVLGREVAIKVLPADLAGDPERLSRFEREAKVLASLNHPHIGQLYSFETAASPGAGSEGEIRFLVLELVEGETLAESLVRDPIPVDDAVPLAIQIAQGLEAAHEKGVVHRDLKPANIKITTGGEVKVLDFGLAKPSEAVFHGDLTESPTLTYAPTGVGVILGTAAYMSPEQVRGQEVDKRSDIWAFGVVLWEMLTGKKLFGGETVSDILASTLMREPNWQGLPDGLPVGVTRVLKRCLVQDPKERLHDIADARIELQEVLEEPEVPLETVVTPKPLWLRAAPWVVLPLALAMGWFLRPVPEPESVPTVRFEIPLPEGERLTHMNRHGVAFSPDGATVAFVSGTLNRAAWPERTQIHLQVLDRWESRPVAGTEGTGQPIFSPDGLWLAFTQLTPDFRILLRKIPIEGGDPETICECDASFGLSWGTDDQIVFGISGSGLQRVPVVGGKPEPITFLDKESGETRHTLPRHLPNGKGVLLTVVVGRSMFGNPGSIQVKPQLSGARKLLVAEGSDARYVPTGHLVYVRKGQLFAIRFDLDRLKVSGPEVPVLDGVLQSTHLEGDGMETLAGQFSLSDSGSLAYVAGSVYPVAPGVFLYADREGKTEPVEMEPKRYFTARINRDQRRLLVTATYPPAEAWIHDLERGTLTRQTFGGKTVTAVWGPEPDEITFSSFEEGSSGIFRKPINTGPETTKRLIGEEEEFDWVEPGSWSPSGTTLVFFADGDIWTYSSETGSVPFLQSEYFEGGPEFSPDGRWLAYVSYESGQGEVYVRPYPGPGPSVQISTSGGSLPTWTHDGSEILFFRREQGTGQYFVVPVEAAAGRLIADLPQLLFQGDRYVEGHPRSYEVLADGRLLVLPMPSGASMEEIEGFFPTRIQIVQNWFAEIEAKMPASR